MSDPREAAERAAAFKPGDRVMVTDPMLLGEVGTVVEVFHNGAYPSADVDLDRHGPGVNFGLHELEPAPSTPAAVQGGGDGLRETAENAAREWWNSAEVYGGTEYRIRSLADLLVSFAALRAAAAPVGPAKDSEPILTWHANEGWSVLAKDGARFRLVPSSTPAAIQGGGEALARSIVEDVYLRLTQAGGEFNQDELDDCIASVLSELAALRAAPAPVPEVSDDMVERACARFYQDHDFIWGDTRNISADSLDEMRSSMRAALTAALASASAQDREGEE